MRRLHRRGLLRTSLLLLQVLPLLHLLLLLVYFLLDVLLLEDPLLLGVNLPLELQGLSGLRRRKENVVALMVGVELGDE